MVERPRCSAMSCLRPNAYSELTGAVIKAFSAIAAPTMRRTLSTVMASVKFQPLATSAASASSPLPTSTTLSGSPLAGAVGIGGAAWQLAQAGAQFVHRQVRIVVHLRVEGAQRGVLVVEALGRQQHREPQAHAVPVPDRRTSTKRPPRTCDA